MTDQPAPPREEEVAEEFAVHAPQRPSSLRRTPRVTWRPPVPGAAFTWVSAHGGAGSTSLARSSGEGIDLTSCWPDPGMGWPAAVALVCRSDAAGVAAAARMLAEAASGSAAGLKIVALVVVADIATKPPKAVRERIYELSSTVPQLVRVPWVRSWRETPYQRQNAAVEAAATVAAAVSLKEHR
ncbi:DUF6668 family protein [Pimelobacter sp. 30-1]|uniref:DUF6668 family protein n=1 Tax=Pimelobacter sp. 30-1 TaxID=2004991 RepID=UPI001C04B579|nr:DUF6668 family protein [Pimelobacter sp. 30-1]